VNNEIYIAFLLNSKAQSVSGKMNNLPKHHSAGPPEEGAQCSCIGCISSRPALLTLHASQVHCFGVMHWWACSSLLSAPMLAEESGQTCDRFVLLYVFIAYHGNKSSEVHFK